MPYVVELPYWYSASAPFFRIQNAHNACANALEIEFRDGFCHSDKWGAGGGINATLESPCRRQRRLPRYRLRNGECVFGLANPCDRWGFAFLNHHLNGFGQRIDNPRNVRLRAVAQLEFWFVHCVSNMSRNSTRFIFVRPTSGSLTHDVAFPPRSTDNHSTLAAIPFLDVHILARRHFVGLPLRNPGTYTLVRIVVCVRYPSSLPSSGRCSKGYMYYSIMEVLGNARGNPLLPCLNFSVPFPSTPRQAIPSQTTPNHASHSFLSLASPFRSRPGQANLAQVAPCPPFCSSPHHASPSFSFPFRAMPLLASPAVPLLARPFLSHPV